MRVRGLTTRWWRRQHVSGVSCCGSDTDVPLLAGGRGCGASPCGCMDHGGSRLPAPPQAHRKRGERCAPRRHVRRRRRGGHLIGGWAEDLSAPRVGEGTRESNPPCCGYRQRGGNSSPRTGLGRNARAFGCHPPRRLSRPGAGAGGSGPHSRAFGMRARCGGMRQERGGN
jgi:hypothetical protein